MLAALLAGGGLPETATSGGTSTSAAEAQGRKYVEVLTRNCSLPYGLNASDVPDSALDEGGRSRYGGLTLHGGIENPGRCEIDLSVRLSDLYCVSYTERALITIKNSGASVPYRAYHSGGRAGVGDVHHAEIQITGENFKGNKLKMGRAGLADLSP